MGFFSWIDSFKPEEVIEKEKPTAVFKEEEPKSDIDSMREIMRNLDKLSRKAEKLEGFDGTARRIDMALKEASSEISMFNERERIKKRQSIGMPSARSA